MALLKSIVKGAAGCNRKKDPGRGSGLKTRPGASKRNAKKERSLRKAKASTGRRRACRDGRVRGGTGEQGPDEGMSQEEWDAAMDEGVELREGAMSEEDMPEEDEDSDPVPDLKADSDSEDESDDDSSDARGREGGVASLTEPQVVLEVVLAARKNRKSPAVEEDEDSDPAPDLKSDSDSDEESDDDLPGVKEWESGFAPLTEPQVVLAARKSRKSPAEEQEYGWKEEEEVMDFTDNLTYHEDSLSVLKGTYGAEDVPVWVVTDSGSMTQLMKYDVAVGLKLPIKDLKGEDSFAISSPGGGRDDVSKYVILSLKIRVKKEANPGQRYGDIDAEEEEVEVRMQFGLCESLPVPILWGGSQMRGYDLLDYHSNKVVTMNVKGERVATPSSSWLVAAAEMSELTDKRWRKIYSDFIPSRERLTNMVKGERKTHNVPALLYPGKDSVVRVGRHNARVDEGYNQITCLNPDKVAEVYSGWVQVIDSVANGEATIIVRNNSEQALRLPAGLLEIGVSPVIEIPRAMSALEFQKVQGPVEEAEPLAALATLSEYNSMAEETREAANPAKFFSWNCDGLRGRVQSKTKDLERFYGMVADEAPDILSLQEVRLPAQGPDEQGRVRQGGADEAVWEEFYAPLRGRYDAFLTLDVGRYGGQAVLVKKGLAPPTITYNTGDQAGHYSGGRFMKLEFPGLIVTSVYAPFNGTGQPGHLGRRQEWDEALFQELAGSKSEKGRVAMGDFNAVYRDSDMSNHPSFWLGQGDQTTPLADRGFGGTTINERTRFQNILECGELADTFTPPNEKTLQARWTFRGQGKFYGKGYKVDYILADDSIVLSGGVKSSRILCNGRDRDGFMGSDHAPVLCELHPRWNTKKRILQAHYDAAEGDQKATWKYRTRTREEQEQVRVMFTNTQARAPKTVVVKGAVHPGMSIERPEEFPEHLWHFCDPEERGEVQARFDKFKSLSYLQKCVQAIVTELDIQEREEYHSPTWKSEEDDEDWLQGDLLRAQAIANVDIFFFPDPDKVAMAKDVIAEVETLDGKSFKCRTRKFSVVQQAFLQAKTNIMLRMRQLEDAKSDWCHGLVLVAYEERINRFMEKHGDQAMELIFAEEHEAEVATFFRLCIDLRMLNAKTVPDRFPLPRIDDLLESIPRGCGRFSISDIADAFFKCELKKEHRHKTAFKTHNKHLQFSVLPQGFINSPSVFCRLIARTFEGTDRSKFSAYIDDVLTHVEDFGGHCAVQQDVYNRLRDSQLTLKLSKTHLNYSEVKFLGHILTKDGRLPDPKAVEAIREWKDPTTAKEVRSFLGATLYYREYIYEYSDMAMPLYDLIRKGVVVDKAWDPVIHGRAIQGIKDALTSKPVLMQVDNTKKFRLKVDACRVGRGIGGILEQQNADGKWQPVSYYSSSLNTRERDYSATELECKALHDCILHYAVYLKYIPHFEVFSDHNALRYMVGTENATTNGRLMRYLLDLQEYNFSIYYRKGTENCDADAVSRLKRTSDSPVYLTEDELCEENGVISRQLLQRARNLDTRNKKLEKEASKLMRKLNKGTLEEMSKLNDHILAEGVENLESDSGRARFFEHLKQTGLKCSREKLNETLEAMKEDQGRMGDDCAAADVLGSDEPAMVNLVGIWSECGPVEAASYPLRCLQTYVVKDEAEAKPYYEAGYGKAESGAALPGLLSLMLEVMQDQEATQGEAEAAPAPFLEEYTEAALSRRRERVCNRVEKASARREHAKAKPRGRGEDVQKWRKPEKVVAGVKETGSTSRTTKPPASSSRTTRSTTKKGGGQAKGKGKDTPRSSARTLVRMLKEGQTAIEKEIARDKTSQANSKDPSSSSSSRETEAVTEEVPRPSSQPEKRQGLRPRTKLSYQEEVKIAPNWIVECRRDPTLESVVSTVNHQLETIRKTGYGTVEVRKSLIPGDSGQGLFVRKKGIKEGDILCSYEGVEVTRDQLRLGYGSRDYIASAVKDHAKPDELTYIDGESELSCYGRFAQDCIDDLLVNAKILYRKGKMVLVAMDHLEVGDEIYISYGLDYWKTRLDFLVPELRERIAHLYQQNRRNVQFEDEVTVARFKEGEPATKIRIEKEGNPLQRTPENARTRLERTPPETVEETAEAAALVAAGGDEDMLGDFDINNINESPELAEELQFLNGRKFVDEGRLYEIFGVRWEEKWEHIIGFRKSLTGTTHNQSGSSFLVYGREGLYELSELYLLEHPEERVVTPWPVNNIEFAALQRADPALLDIMNSIREKGTETLKVGRHTYCLGATDQEEDAMLVRVVQDTRKGLIRQTVVPDSLVKAALRVHHEGFGHMGANRMLETIRLRYFWIKMHEDIVKHSKECINCKLRRSYQRRPQVPIMKYDETVGPLDRVHVDLTGPFNKTKDGKNRYIMVVKDYLTKYVWLIPLKTKGAVEVAVAFVGEFICLAGIPGRVVSDRGNEFVNSLLNNVSRILNINRVSTTPYNPRSDGFVENHNKTLKDQLFHYVDNLKQDDWDVYLPTAQLMYNTTVSLSTGYTPYLLMHGREARMPSFSHMEGAVRDLNPRDDLSNEFVRKMVATMRGYHDHAMSQTTKNKGRFNAKVRKPLEFVEYEPGAQFFRVRRPVSSFKSVDEKEAWKISMKLLERFEGPYTIIRKINPVLYDADVEGKEIRVHASNMKPF